MSDKVFSIINVNITERVKAKMEYYLRAPISYIAEKLDIH